jgi:cytochrome c553
MMLGLNRVWVGSGVATAGLLAFVLWYSAQPFAANAADKPSSKSVVEFTKDGNLMQPTGYRKWPFIGTPLTPNDMNGGEAPFPEFHIVYMDPESFAHYEKTGEYRDGTTLVKELTSVGTKEATSGKGYFMGEYIGLEVSMKDSNRFKGEPGNWAYFSFGHKYPLKTSAAKAAAASCNDCHQKNAEQDYVFTQYYPVLRAAAPKK